MLHSAVVLAVLLYTATLTAQSIAPTPDDFDEAVADAFARGAFPSLVVGVVVEGELVHRPAFGHADRERAIPATSTTLYRVGSITKVFTTTLLAVLRDEGVVRLSDPLADYLPNGIAPPTDDRGAPQITLEHLATHSSGYPTDPPNLQRRGDAGWGGYTEDQLLAAAANAQLVFPPGSRVRYSNLGMGLLGYAIERATGVGYEQLLRERLLDPLAMNDTRITLSAVQRTRLAVGYRGDATDEVSTPWDLGVLRGIGPLCSTVEDLARWLALQMRAGTAQSTPVRGSTLRELHRPRHLLPDWRQASGLGWVVERRPHGDVVRHNGGMGGYTSHLGFSPVHRTGIVILSNKGIGGDGNATVAALAERLLPLAIAAFGMRIEREVATALATATGESPTGDEELARLFHPAFLQRIPLSSIRPELRKLVEGHGPCRAVTGLRPGVGRGEAEFRLLLADEIEAAVRISLDRQGRILSLRIDG